MRPNTSIRIQVTFWYRILFVFVFGQFFNSNFNFSYSYFLKPNIAGIFSGNLYILCWVLMNPKMLKIPKSLPKSESKDILQEYVMFKLNLSLCSCPSSPITTLVSESLIHDVAIQSDRRNNVHASSRITSNFLTQL